MHFILGNLFPVHRASATRQPLVSVGLGPPLEAAHRVLVLLVRKSEKGIHKRKHLAFSLGLSLLDKWQTPCLGPGVSTHVADTCSSQFPKGRFSLAHQGFRFPGQFYLRLVDPSLGTHSLLANPPLRQHSPLLPGCLGVSPWALPRRSPGEGHSGLRARARPALRLSVELALASQLSRAGNPAAPVVPHVPAGPVGERHFCADFQTCSAPMGAADSESRHRGSRASWQVPVPVFTAGRTPVETPGAGDTPRHPNPAPFWGAGPELWSWVRRVPHCQPLPPTPVGRKPLGQQRPLLSDLRAGLGHLT